MHYITFRSMGAFLTSFFIVLFLMPSFIRKLVSVQKGGQPIRSDGPESHLKTKVGTPTMGGLMIVIGVLTGTLIWADLTNKLLWIVLLVFLSYGFLGFIDDFLKVTKRNSKGLRGKQKLIIQISIAALAYYLYIYSSPDYSHHLLNFPFFKNIILNLGWFYMAFAIVVIVGASNAVNLTDGLDGLATIPTIVATACYSLIAYLVGHKIFADYLFVQYIPTAGELSILCAAVIGSSLGFLWYNAQPAQIFMGDTGSLSLGGLIGTIAMITKHEIILVLIGGLFVMEAMSVILQVYYFKLTGGKRIFKMAPIHHHFEKLGWPETRVVVRFWIISIIFAIIGIASLKLR